MGPNQGFPVLFHGTGRPSDNEIPELVELAGQAHRILKRGVESSAAWQLVASKACSKGSQLIPSKLSIPSFSFADAG